MEGICTALGSRDDEFSNFVILCVRLFLSVLGSDGYFYLQDNVNYGIKAHVSLVGAPIEIQKDFLRPITNLIVEYTVRDNNSPEVTNQLLVKI